MAAPQALPFLRIPPFPGHRAGPLARIDAAATITDEEATALAAALREHRIGGTFWAPPASADLHDKLVLAPENAAQLAEMIAARPAAGAVLLAPSAIAAPAGMTRIEAPCDPWSLAEQAGGIWAGAGHELALVAALSGKSARLFGSGAFADCAAAEAFTVRALAGWRYRDPFSGADWEPREAIAQLGEWRRLIESNRTLARVYGIAGWKRVTLDAMLWDGSEPVRHARRADPVPTAADQVAVWKSRTPPALVSAIAASGSAVAEIEDGFIRSSGLGANCVPPLSAIVDFSGVYFDPAGPSDLERLLEYSAIDLITCERAARLRERLVEAAISKYGQGSIGLHRPADGRRRILVTGQVEDDRSILSGGKGLSNLELLAAARALESDAWIIYKPHPDVEAGHRKGFVPEADALRFADEIQRDAPITALIDVVDGLHVITSLAGFEALLRGKPVTTHGVPFYAGWGLTRDLGAIPARRTRKRSLDELVAATLLLYPRYLDPVTRLPCPAEVVVERMARGEARVTSPLVTLREWQGRIQALWRSITGGR